MAVAFRAASEDDRGTSGICVPTPPPGTQSADIELAIQASDKRGTLSEMTAPAGWVEIANNSDRSADVGFIKVWRKIAGSSEPSSYSFPDSTSAHCDVVIVSLYGYDPTAPLSVNPTWNNGGAQTTHVAPSVNGLTDDMLITAYIAGTNGTTRSYSGDPAGMTLTKDSTLSSGGYILLAVYYRGLPADGATGTEIATCSASTPFVALSLVVQEPHPKTVSPSAIDTAETFGSPTVTVSAAPQTVSPAGITSAEALGAPVVTVAAGDQTVNAVAIDTAETFGSPTVLPDLLITPGGITSLEAFGGPTVTGGADPASSGTLYPGDTSYPGSDTYPGASGVGPFPDVTLWPGAGIYPGVPFINATDQTVYPAGIASAEALGLPVVTVADGDLAANLTGIDSAEAFGVPVVTVAEPSLVVSPDGIASAEAFGERAFVFVEVAPPVPTGADTYFVEGIDLTSQAWRIETAEGLQMTPGVIGEDVVLPGRDGGVEVFGGFGQQRRPDAIGKIVFSLWLKGVDPATGLIPGGSTTAQEYFARWDTLVRIFHRRRVTIDHVRADGPIRRAVAHLVPGESIAPSRVPSSPWFGRLKATFAIPAAHWTDTYTVGTGQQSLTTGSSLDLSAFSGATAPCTELTVVFGAGNNPRLSTSWGHIGWNAVIAGSRQLGIDTATGTTNQAGGTAWTPGYDALTFAPGPLLFEIDPSEPLSAVLTHTGGGTMTVQVTGKRRYRTS